MQGLPHALERYFTGNAADFRVHTVHEDADFELHMVEMAHPLDCSECEASDGDHSATVPCYVCVSACERPTREMLESYHDTMRAIYARREAFYAIVDCRSIVSAPLGVIWAQAKFMKHVEGTTRAWMRGMDIHTTPAGAALVRALFALRRPCCPVRVFV